MRPVVLRSLVTGLLVTALVAPSAHAQAKDRFAGHWAGAITLPTGPLAIDLDLKRDGGGYAGDFSVPAQGLHDAPLTGVTVKGDSLRAGVSGIPGAPTLAGVLSADGRTLKGVFTQGGQALPFSLAAEASPAEKARQALANYGPAIDSMLSAWQVVGAGIGVIVDGEVVYVNGHGFRDREKKAPVTPRTLFAIGSSTKAFTTFTMASLAEQGKLDWDAPVRTYIPWFRLYDPSASERLTPRDLVTHRSGLPRHDLVWYNNTTSTREELVRKLAYLPPNKDLRELFQYNNLMFLTAGYLVGQLNGTSWEDAVRQLVFKPLGMGQSGFSVLDMQKTSDFSYPYDVAGDTIRKIPFRDITLIGPAGSINSSVDDMLKWVGMHLAGGKAGGKQLVGAALMKQMYTSQMAIGASPFGADPAIGPVSYGLGWFISTYHGHLHVFHGGNIDGFSALVTLLPDDRTGIVVLSNQNGSQFPGLVTQHLIDRLLDLPLKDHSAEALARRAAAKAGEKDAAEKAKTLRVAGTQPSHPLADYAGEYRHPGYGTFTIEVEHDTLVGTFNGIRTRFEHYHYDTFNGLAGPSDHTFEGSKLTFRSNAKGEISGFETLIEPQVAPQVFERQPDARLRDPAVLARFAGRYLLRADTVTVTLAQTTLTVNVPGQPPYVLEAQRNNEFVFRDLKIISVVFKEEGGKVTAMETRQPNGVFTAKRLD